MHDATFKIINTKLYVPIVTLSSKDNVKLVKLLEEGFKRPVYWNECQTKIEPRDLDNNNITRFPLDASFQGVRRLFVLAINNATVNVPNNPINNTNNRVLRNSPTQNIFFQENIKLQSRVSSSGAIVVTLIFFVVVIVVVFYKRGLGGLRVFYKPFFYYEI